MEVPWHGCVDHILELTTGKAFSDTDTTAGAMSQARALVGHFSMSTQATTVTKCTSWAGRKSGS